MPRYAFIKCQDTFQTDTKWVMFMSFGKMGLSQSFLYISSIDKYIYSLGQNE